MKKTMMILMVFCLLLGLFTGCGKSDGTDSEYVKENGKLVIDGLSLEEGGTPLTWTKK